MAYIALDLGYINKEDFDSIQDMAIETSKILAGFIKKL